MAIQPHFLHTKAAVLTNRSRYLRRSLLAQPKRQGREEVKERGRTTTPLSSPSTTNQPFGEETSQPCKITGVLVGTNSTKQNLPLSPSGRQIHAPSHFHLTQYPPDSHTHQPGSSPNLAQAQQGHGNACGGAEIGERGSAGEHEKPWRTIRPRNLGSSMFDGRQFFLLLLSLFFFFFRLHIRIARGTFFFFPLVLFCFRYHLPFFIIRYLFFDSS